MHHIFVFEKCKIPSAIYSVYHVRIGKDLATLGVLPKISFKLTQSIHVALQKS